jgi:ankyrin repeat protein
MKGHPRLRDVDGLTVLSWAIDEGNEAAVRLLLETGKINPDSTDMNG